MRLSGGRSHRRIAAGAIVLLLVGIAFLLFPFSNGGEAGDKTRQEELNRVVDPLDLHPQESGNRELVKANEVDPKEHLPAPDLVPGRIMVVDEDGRPIEDALILVRLGGLFRTDANGVADLTGAEGDIEDVLIAAPGFSMRAEWIGWQSVVVTLRKAIPLHFLAESKQDLLPIEGLTIAAAANQRWLNAPAWNEFEQRLSQRLQAETGPDGRASLVGIDLYQSPVRLHLQLGGRQLGILRPTDSIATQIDIRGYCHLLLDVNREPRRVRFQDAAGNPLTSCPVSIAVTQQRVPYRTDEMGCIYLIPSIELTPTQDGLFDYALVELPSGDSWVCWWRERVELEGELGFTVGAAHAVVDARSWVNGYEYATTTGPPDQTDIDNIYYPNLEALHWKELVRSNQIGAPNFLGTATRVVVRHRESQFIIAEVAIPADGRAVIECLELGALSLIGPTMADNPIITWMLQPVTLDQLLQHRMQTQSVSGSSVKLNVPVGRYEISCYCNGSAIGKQAVVVDSDGAAVEIQKAPTQVSGTLSGSLTGLAVGREIMAYGKEEDHLYSQVRTNAQGRYTVYLNREGDSNFYIHWPVKREGRAISGAGAETISIRLHAAVAEGQDTNLRINEGSLTILTNTSEDTKLPLSLKMNRLDVPGADAGEQGSFYLEVLHHDKLILPVGEYRLQFYLGSAAPEVIVVQVTEGENARVSVDLGAIQQLSMIAQGSESWKYKVSIRVWPEDDSSKIVAKWENMTLSASEMSTQKCLLWLSRGVYTVEVTGEATSLSEARTQPLSRQIRVEMSDTKSIAIELQAGGIGPELVLRESQ